MQNAGRLAALIGRGTVLVVALGAWRAAPAAAQSRQDNLAWKRPVMASKGAVDMWGLNDGKYGTKADVVGNGWFVIDLGEPHAVGRAFFVFRGRPFSNGKLSWSNDGVAWTELWHGCGWSPGCPVTFYGQELTFAATTARFFRMDCSPPPEFNQTSFYEFELYEPGSSSDNLALGKLAVSPANNYHQVAYMPNMRVTDGDLSTAIWMLYVPQWIVVDLGAPTLINRIRTVSSISGPSQDFTYYASDDNVTWTKLFDHKPGVSSQAFTSNVFDRVTARYVKGEFHDKPLQGNSAAIQEIMIYGPGTSAVDIPTLPMNAAPPPAPDARAVAPDASAIDTPDAGAPQDAGAADVAGASPPTPDATAPPRTAGGCAFSPGRAGGLPIVIAALLIGAPWLRRRRSISPARNALHRGAP